MIFLIFSTMALAAATPPAPFPVFLKAGFSSVLEFDEAPTRIVLGDGQKFQVEKLEHSLVIKTLAPFAVTNMFVYFREKEPRLFVLTASEDAQPTFYKSFMEPPLPKVVAPTVHTTPASPRGGRVTSLRFDAKKDYLTIEFAIRADAGNVLHPNWTLARLMFAGTAIVPYKLWAERREVQKNAEVRARLIFAKPNVPRNLAGASLVVPLEGSSEPIRIPLKGGKR